MTDWRLEVDLKQLNDWWLVTIWLAAAAFSNFSPWIFRNFACKLV